MAVVFQSRTCQTKRAQPFSAASAAKRLRTVNQEQAHLTTAIKVHWALDLVLCQYDGFARYDPVAMAVPASGS
jgi:hypothetical protein